MPKFETCLWLTLSSRFCLRDEAVDDCPDICMEEAISKGASAAPGIIVVDAERDLDIPITIEVQSELPSAIPENWHEIFDRSIEISSGHLIVEGLGDRNADLTIALELGVYCARGYGVTLGPRHERSTVRERLWEEHVRPFQFVLWPSR